METEIHKANEIQQQEFEQKITQAMHESLQLQQHTINEREARIITLERDMFDRQVKTK